MENDCMERKRISKKCDGVSAWLCSVENSNETSKWGVFVLLTEIPNFRVVWGLFVSGSRRQNKSAMSTEREDIIGKCDGVSV